MKIVQRLLGEGDVRHGETTSDLGPDDARALLGAWLGALEIEPERFLALLQDGELTHADLLRRARLCHEHRLADAVTSLPATALPRSSVCAAARPARCLQRLRAGDSLRGRDRVPGRREAQARRGEVDLPRIGLAADGLDAMHGVSAAVRQIRERGVRGFEVEVIGTDRDVDRRLSAVAEVPDARTTPA